MRQCTADSTKITLQDRGGHQTIFWRSLSYQEVVDEVDYDINSPVIYLQLPHKQPHLHISRTPPIIFYFATVLIVFHLLNEFYHMEGTEDNSN